MSEREICVIVQPCILCEGDLEAWHVYMDEETTVESIIVEALEHDCQPMRSLIQERLGLKAWRI